MSSSEKLPLTPTPKRPSSRASIRSMKSSAVSSLPPPLPPSYNPVVNLDRMISRLTIILSTPAGTDSVLRTITYTLQFIVYGLQNIMENHLDKVMGLVVTINQFKSKIFPPKPKSRSSGGGKKKKAGGPNLLPMVLQTVPRARKLSALITDFRTFTRLWGLLGMYTWAKGLMVNPPKDFLLKMVAWGQCLAYTGYQALENRAYLSGKGIWAKRGEKEIISDWLWSSRMWMVGVGFEFIRLLRVWQLWKTRVMTADEEKKESATWRRELIANCSNAPLTVHWSVEGGKLGDTTVGFLGMVGGYVGLAERWRVAGEQIGIY